MLHFQNMPTLFKIWKRRYFLKKGNWYLPPFAQLKLVWLMKSSSVISKVLPGPAIHFLKSSKTNRFLIFNISYSTCLWKESTAIKVWPGSKYLNGTWVKTRRFTIGNLAQSIGSNYHYLHWCCLPEKLSFNNLDYLWLWYDVSQLTTWLFVEALSPAFFS